jgi:butyrate kinase
VGSSFEHSERQDHGGSQQEEGLPSYLLDKRVVDELNEVLRKAKKAIQEAERRGKTG